MKSVSVCGPQLAAHLAAAAAAAERRATYVRLLRDRAE